MRKIVAVIAVLLALSFAARAQGGRGSDPAYQYQSIRVKAKVLDAKSLAPIPYATVYLIPQGDTTITNISLSGEDGTVVLEGVVSGRYELNAELLGYKTFTKPCEISQAPGWDLDLGTISLEEDAEQIDAATVTAAGNPVTIQNDTLIYHASSFHVGENAMLEDLLKKMPGIVVSEDGTATVNGEKVDRLTIGGKTFFFGDPSVALKNLPAKIVDRILVTREETTTAQMHGISTEFDKETVLDVELKEEFQEGWFGDARLGAGAVLAGNDGGPLTERSKFLYDANALASVYGKRDQLVVIGNAYNIQEPGSGASGAVVPEDAYTELGGLTTALRAGANYNTDRIRHFETTVSANYRHATKDDRERSSRTSFISGGGDLLTEGGTDAAGQEDQLMLDVELTKEKGTLLVDFTPMFFFRRSQVNSLHFADIHSPGSTTPLHTSATSVTGNRQFLTGGSLGITGKDLGRPGRRLGLTLDYSAGASRGDESERSLQVLDYDILGNKLDLDASLFYYEPLGERWGVEASLGNVVNASLSDRRAFDADGSANHYYTSRTGHRFLQEGASLLMQYAKAPGTIKFGFNAAAYNDRTDVRSLGVDAVTGERDWRFRWSPIVMYSYTGDGHQLTLQYSSVTNPASGRQLIPVPDITNPIQITTGNTYLKSGVSNNLMAYYNMVNYTTFTFLTVYANAEIEHGGAVYASWFDATGTRYAVPVNARRPGTRANAYGILNQPFGPQKHFTLSVAAQAAFDNQFSYQALSLQPGLNLDDFDYDAFMDGFWGDASGDRFYSGRSGFAESRTRSFNWGLGLNLKYNKDFFTGTLAANASNGRASYSLNPDANLNTWDFNFGVDLLFQPGRGWEIGSDTRYVFFRGYAPGFGQPELRWNASLSKSIKSVTLGLRCNDILNQQRSLTRTVSSEYVEDTYRNVMGRTFLFSVSFNFGKLNTHKTAAVSGSIDRLGY